MSKKKVETPPIPEFFQDPVAAEGSQFGLDFGKALSTLNFGQGSGFENLQDLIDLDPEQTTLALDFAESALRPSFDRQRQDTVNQLANLGGVTGSGATTAFTDLDRDLNSQLQAITTGAALDDRNRALSNALGLVGLGSQQLGQSTDFGLRNQSDRNIFNQQQFENRLGIRELEADTSGGLFGGISGGLGGLALGAGLAPFTGGASLLGLGATAGLGTLGGFAGAKGPAGTGGSIFKSGLGLLGNILGSTAGAGESFGGQSEPFTDFFRKKLF